MVVYYGGQMGEDGITLLNFVLVNFNPSLYRSQSRMRGDYLFYEEKIETTQEERDAKAARR